MKSIFNINTNSNTKLSNEELSVDKPFKKKPKIVRKLGISQEGLFGWFKDKKEDKKEVKSKDEIKEKENLNKNNFKEYLENLLNQDSYNINLPTSVKDINELNNIVKELIHSVFPHYEKEFKRFTDGLNFLKQVKHKIIEEDNLMKFYDLVKIDHYKLDKDHNLQFKYGINIHYYFLFKNKPAFNNLINVLTNEKTSDILSDWFDLTLEEGKKICPFFTIAEIIPTPYDVDNHLHVREHEKIILNKNDHLFKELINNITKLLELCSSAEQKNDKLLRLCIDVDDILQTTEISNSDEGDGDEFGLYAELFIQSGFFNITFENWMFEDIEHILKQ